MEVTLSILTGELDVCRVANASADVFVQGRYELTYYREHINSKERRGALLICPHDVVLEFFKVARDAAFSSSDDSDYVPGNVHQCATGIAFIYGPLHKQQGLFIVTAR